MITAVDSSVLFDVILGHPAFGPSSMAALEEAAGSGLAVICDVVVAEIRPFFISDFATLEFLARAALNYRPFSIEATFAAGRLWAVHHREAARSRRAVADFLIAGHAMTEANRLLTRDQEFLRLPLEHLQVVIPGT